MTDDRNKYDRMIKLLRKSGPVLHDPETLEGKIMDEILKQEAGKERPQSILNYLFGWVYIGWMRRGLIAISVAAILIFIFQQSVILRRINAIGKQAAVSGTVFSSEPLQDIDQKQLLMKLTVRMPVKGMTLSGKEIHSLIRSYDELQTKYMDLLKVIEDDPELKQYIERKLTERQKRKFNL